MTLKVKVTFCYPRWITCQNQLCKPYDLEQYFIWYHHLNAFALWSGHLRSRSHFVPVVDSLWAIIIHWICTMTLTIKALILKSRLHFVPHDSLRGCTYFFHQNHHPLTNSLRDMLIDVHFHHDLEPCPSRSSSQYVLLLSV